MTTIAYNHKDKEIAVDSRTSRDTIVISDKKNKVQVIDGVIYIGCGDTEHIINLIDALAGKIDPSSISLNDALVFWVNKGVVFKSGFNGDDGVWTQSINFSEAVGSGDFWAMAAMDFGCSAKDAVKYAMTRDMYTGGKIRVIKVK